MTAHLPARYDRAFFDLQATAGSDVSLDRVAALLVSLLSPRSVVDVGCGVGNLVAAMRRLGVPRVLGIDGPWVPADIRAIPPECFREHDLTQPIAATEQFDLVVSLEAAEHLDPGLAGAFVRSLVGLGPVVAFSAAIPHQGGTHHVNEQWPAYWARHFSRHGFVPIDCLRPQLLGDDQVAHCYGQNTVLYVNPRGAGELVARLLTDAARGADYPLPVVHPTVYLRLIDQAENAPYRLGLFRTLKLLPALLLQGIRRRFGR